MGNLSTRLFASTLCFLHLPSTFLQGDDVSDVPRHGPRQRVPRASIFGDVMRGISLHEIGPSLEPFFRRVVRDQVDLTIQRLYQSSTSSSSRVWQLEFQHKFPDILFTCTKVESTDGEPIKVVLVDPISKRTITSGPLSSVKIEIVVLNGDFLADESENWTEEDFKRNIIREREGKRPLVTGDLTISLKDGVAALDNICFTDNSCWIRCRKFRLGARLQGGSAEVREAKSEAFVVKDHRGEAYKKHHPPLLADDVWRLEKIAKDGEYHKRLVALAGISTVKEFLQMYVTDPSLLRKVIGGDSGISNKIWDTIIEHATTCVLDNKMYLYTGAARRVMLVFNSIWKVIGATFDGQNYQNLDSLSFPQMRLVEEVKQQAYVNLDDLVPFSEQPFIDPATLLSSLHAESFYSSSTGLLDAKNPIADQGYVHMTTSAPYAFEVGNESSLEVSRTNDCHPMQATLPAVVNSFEMKDISYGFENKGHDPPSGSLNSVLMTGKLIADDISKVQKSTWQWNELFLASNNPSADFVLSDTDCGFPRNQRPKAWWCKLRAVITWGIFVRRDVAAKREARSRGLL
ncbi:Calmodulin-binding protein 60 B like [Heracleum sosnowskyi]|uniref:Calmodulin-binding protein 60 B like n=1 Tax=Heracleum sosnowskyi TaxID=360622 RepID=A0AAD8N9L2_9APIA|nr:Calmodulin-binding protein 60 B like [Heracleum sosnowskyi]